MLNEKEIEQRVKQIKTILSEVKHECSQLIRDIIVLETKLESVKTNDDTRLFDECAEKLMEKYKYLDVL